MRGKSRLLFCAEHESLSEELAVINHRLVEDNSYKVFLRSEIFPVSQVRKIWSFGDDT